MRANKRLKNVVKIGYLDTPADGEKVIPELPPIEIDITPYEKKESFLHAYNRVGKEIKEEKRIAKNSISSGQEVAGFWESYLHGIGLVFKFMGKVGLFLVFALFGRWIITTIDKMF